MRVRFPSKDVAYAWLMFVRAKPTSWNDAVKAAVTFGGTPIEEEEPKS